LWKHRFFLDYLELRIACDTARKRRCDAVKIEPVKNFEKLEARY
jgi:hypothetical protein